MALPAGKIKVIVNGTLPGTEVFAHSQGFDPQFETITQAEMDHFAEAVWSAFKTNFLTTGVKAGWPNVTTWTGVKAYLLGAGGAAVLTAVSTSASQAGTASTSPCPDQCALVVTQLTGVPGRSHRGRAYLPGPATGALVAGQLNTPTPATVAAAYMAWLQAVADEATTPAVASVLSSTLSSAGHITFVRVDSRLDVQRRRGDKQVVTSTATSTALVP